MRTGTVTRPACMSPEEFALWREAAETYERQVGKKAVSPCSDCVRHSAFRLAAVTAGACDGNPGRRRYKPCDDPSIAARRAGWRASNRRRLERIAARGVA